MQFSSNSEVYEETLLQSLEISFMQLKLKDPKSIDIFLLLGLTHDGLTKQNLFEIFSESGTEDRLKVLCDTSFIQVGKVLGDQEVYRVPYLVDFFIDHKLEPGAKHELYSILAEHFNRQFLSFLGSQ